MRVVPARALDSDGPAPKLRCYHSCPIGAMLPVGLERPAATVNSRPVAEPSPTSLVGPLFPPPAPQGHNMSYYVKIPKPNSWLAPCPVPVSSPCALLPSAARSAFIRDRVPSPGGWLPTHARCFARGLSVASVGVFSVGGVGRSVSFFSRRSVGLVGRSVSVHCVGRSRRSIGLLHPSSVAFFLLRRLVSRWLC